MWCFYLFFLASQVYASAFSTGEFEWGKTKLHPQVDQLSISSSALNRSDFKSLPLDDTDDDELSHFNILALKAISEKPKAVNVHRTYERVRFDLFPGSVLANSVNTYVGEAFQSSFSSDEDYVIPPIDPEDPAFMARGMLVSLFRSSVVKDGQAGGKICLGTAFLVSPHCLLTAAHNVVLNHRLRGNPYLSHLIPYAERVEFWPLMNGFPPEVFDAAGNLKNGATSATQVILPPQWDMQVSDCQEHDIAVLKLAKPLGVDFGTLCPREVKESVKDSKVSLSGYPKAIGDTPCFLSQSTGILSDTIAHRVFYEVEPKTQKGHSGAALSMPLVDEFLGVHTGIEIDGKARGIYLNRHNGLLIGKWIQELEAEA